MEVIEIKNINTLEQLDKYNIIINNSINEPLNFKINIEDIFNSDSITDII